MAGSVETAEPVPSGTQDSPLSADSTPVSATPDLTAGVSQEAPASPLIEPTGSPGTVPLTAASEPAAWPVPGPAPTPAPEAADDPPASPENPERQEPQEPQ